MNEPSLTDRLVPGGGTPHGTTLPLDAVHHPMVQIGPRYLTLHFIMPTGCRWLALPTRRRLIFVPTGGHLC